MLLIDWDEWQVDVPDLDLALPHNAAGLDDDTHDLAAQARAAWEAAVCWDPRRLRSQAARGSSSGRVTFPNTGAGQRGGARMAVHRSASE